MTSRSPRLERRVVHRPEYSVCTSTYENSDARDRSSPYGPNYYFDRIKNGSRLTSQGRKSNSVTRPQTLYHFSRLAQSTSPGDRRLHCDIKTIYRLRFPGQLVPTTRSMSGDHRCIPNAALSLQRMQRYRSRAFNVGIVTLHSREPIAKIAADSSICQFTIHKQSSLHTADSSKGPHFGGWTTGLAQHRLH